MTSVNTNAAALTALRNLQSTGRQLDSTQNRISTGLKIGEAKDNAAYWAISTTLKSDNKSLSTVKDALGLGSATVDTAYQGLTKVKDVLDEIKSKLTAATQNGVDRDVIQGEIKELQNQLKSIATSSVFSGENWLSVNSEAVDFSNTKQVVSSFARAADNSVSIGTVNIDISKVSLYDASTVNGAGGILDGAVNLKDSTTGRDLSIGGTTVATGNSSTAGLTAVAGKTTGTINTAAVTGAGTVTGAAATTTLTATGTAATPTKAVFTAAGTYASAQPNNNDAFTFDLTLDGGTAVTGIGFTLSGATSLTDMVSKMQAAIDGSAIGAGKVTVGQNAGKLTITSNTAATGASSSIQIANWTNTTGAARTAGVTNITANGTAGTATSASKVAGTAVSPTGLADGDVMTITYRVDNNTVRTATVNLTAANLASATTLGAAIQGATFAGGLTATSAAGVITFASGTTGSGSTFSIDDVTVKSSAGVIKNVNPFANADLTASKASSSTTGDVATGYATNFAATDKLTFGLTVDGAALDPVTVAAGANLTALVANLNANATFSGKATASIDATSNKLVVTSKTTGATSAATVNTVSFTDANGAAKSVSGSNFTNVATGATASTAAFTAPITLDKDDNLYFSIQVDDATAAKTITINQALVNKTLSTTAAPVTNGKISTADDFKKVIDAALAAQNVAGVTTAKNAANQIVFTSKSVGTASTINISNVQASQGGSTVTVDTIDISAAGLAKNGVTTNDQIKQVLQAYISVVNQAINKVTTAASNLGSVASRIDMQKSFVNTLMDTIDKGVGNLVDADMSEESTKLQALQVKQQLGTQALSIANQSAQSVLSLFRGG